MRFLAVIRLFHEPSGVQGIAGSSRVAFRGSPVRAEAAQTDGRSAPQGVPAETSEDRRRRPQLHPDPCTNASARLPIRPGINGQKRKPRDVGHDLRVDPIDRIR
jgi:hypothetical protein